MKTNSTLIAVLFAFSLTGCKATASDPNAAAFSAASPNVTSVKEVVIAGNTDLDTTLTKLGGFPSSADTAVSKKGVDVQYALGYDKTGKPVIAVSLAKDGTTTVVTDPDLLTGYEKKVKVLSGEKSSSTSSTGSSAPGNDSTGSNSPTKKIKGCPFYVGMSKAEAKQKASGFGTTFHTDHVGSPNELWYIRPLQSGDVAHEGIADAASAVGGGLFGSVIRTSHSNVKSRYYVIQFSGENVASVDVSE